MNIVYVTNNRIPTEMAHGVNMVHMCKAFAGLGHEVTLHIPKRKNPIQEDLFSYYAIDQTFGVYYQPIVELVRFGRVGYTISWLSFAFGTVKHLWKLRKDVVIFSRDEFTGWLMARCGFSVWYDMHGFPETSKWLWKRSMRAMTGIITTNAWKKKQLVDQFGIEQGDILVQPNGFDPCTFEEKTSKEALRTSLNLCRDKPIVLYVGHLYDWKGAHVLVKAAESLPDASVVLVGGSEKIIQQFCEEYRPGPNVQMLGQKPHHEVAKYMQAADVLVVPNSAKSSSKRLAIFSQYDTSPIKLFEYMAAGVPVVASNVPAICEIVNEEIVYFFEADNAKELAAKIQRVLSQPEESARIAKQAHEYVKQFSWENRAKQVLTFISNFRK